MVTAMMMVVVLVMMIKMILMRRRMMMELVVNCLQAKPVQRQVCLRNHAASRRQHNCCPLIKYLIYLIYLRVKQSISNIFCIDFLTLKSHEQILEASPFGN